MIFHVGEAEEGRSGKEFGEVGLEALAALATVVVVAKGFAAQGRHGAAGSVEAEVAAAGPVRGLVAVGLPSVRSDGGYVGNAG